MITALDVTSGICWSIVYITAIFLGFLRKSWYIPKLAICQNLTWELLVVVNRLQSGSYGIAFIIQLVWLLLDIGVLLTWLLYDRKETFSSIKKIGLLLTVFLAMYMLTSRAGKWEFAAFLINAIMSVGFVLWLFQEKTQHSSTVIAVAKLLGTLTATILNGWIWWNPLLLWLGGLCFLLDGYYLIVSLCNKKAGDGFAKTRYTERQK